VCFQDGSGLPLLIATVKVAFSGIDELLKEEQKKES
jgi:hypothetical protein